MGMDALTSAAFDSLVKEVLPKLQKRLAELGKLTAEARVGGGDLPALLAEAQELMALLTIWSSDAAYGEEFDPLLVPEALPEAPAENAGIEADLSDEEAMALLNFEGASDLPDVKISGGKSVADSLSNDSDLDPAGDPAAAAEMSDEEARQLLAMMDAPIDAPTPDESPAGASAEMSDDEAHKLLAMMDAPAAVEAISAVAGDGAEMSDDEARKLLAMMDAPLEAPAPLVDKAARAAEATADDEAMAMLRSLGGDVGDEHHAEPAHAAPSAPVKAAPAALQAPEIDEDSGEVLAEIEELSKNDFASDPDMMNDFSINSDELMETLDTLILQLENNPKDRETIESIFRAAHTLKGAAGMFGFKAMERVMHRMEGLFDQVRKGVLVPDSNIIDVVFQGLDVLRALLETVKTGKSKGTKTVPIVKALSLAAKGKYVKGSTLDAPAQAAAPKVAEVEESVAEAPHAEAKAGAHGVEKKKNEQNSTIRVDLERLDALVNLVGELVIDRTRFASIEEDIRTSMPQPKVAGNMSETVQLFGRHMNEIHEIVMKIRMVPIGNAFNKFTRVVRDLSRQLNKEIELYIDGEDTELDKTLVEQIGDPLIHLIRNSCDHGVELPDVRAAAGKRRTGQILLSARQEGNHIIITIQDDGKGIPVDAIRKKAIERGLIAEDATLSKRDIFNLIFEPGFSTAEKVTNVSGRGVGMDVVRKQISKLKGLIDIDSEPGKGTTTVIRLPLTLAIMQSLLIESAGEVFAIPLSSVVESVRIKPDEIQYVGDAEVIKRHDKVLPLMHLHETLDLAQKAKVSWYSHRGAKDEAAELLGQARINRRKERLYVVIVGSGDRRFGIVVDQLLNQQEMVIKSLGPVMKNTPCVAGGAVLGNGEVVLVLDIQELEDRFRSRVRSKAA